MERSWCRLPFDLLNLISHKLPDVVDFVRFRCVCSSWRSAADPNDLPPQPPWLMLPPPLPFVDDAEDFFCLSAVDQNPRRLYLREARDKFHVAANHGWLLIHSRFDAPFLLNPLTRSQIALPRVVPPISLAALSSNPSSAKGATFEVMIANRCAKELAFWRAGDAEWTAVNCGSLEGFATLTYFSGEFYAADAGGRVVVFNLGSSPPSTKTVFLCPERGFSRCYLVGSKSELFLVRRLWNFEDNRLTELFHVLKLIKEKEKHEWLHMKNIGGRAIFVSDDNSLAISASGVTGCRPNCIYYADPLFKDEEIDPLCILYLLEFSIEDGCLKIIPCYPNKNYLCCEFSWLLPSLC